MNGSRLTLSGARMARCFAAAAVIAEGGCGGGESGPAWASVNGTSVRRYELGVVLSRDYVALKGGYRWTESPNETLDGPFIGVSLRY